MKYCDRSFSMWCTCYCFKGDAVGFQISQFVLTAFHAPCIQTPRSDDLQIRRQGFDGQLKTYLVVAFAGCAVADCCCAFFFRDLHQFLCDDGASHGCAQQVLAFVNSVCLDAGIDRVCDEFFCQVSDIQLACACFQSFFFQTFCFLALTYVAADSDNFRVIMLLQLGNDNGCIQTAGISQYDFFFHDVCPPFCHTMESFMF